jgi:hypothetical protein
LWIGVALASPKINEFIYDLSGRSDAYKEFVELCETDGETDLTGWQLQYAGLDWGELYTYGAESIVAGDYLVHGPDFVDGMWNAENTTSGLRLVDDEGRVIDTVLYGEPNELGLTDDRGAEDGPFAPDTKEDGDESLGRWPDCVDSDLGTDWRAYARPSEGHENPDPDGTPGDTGTEPAPDCGCQNGGQALLITGLLLRRRRVGVARTGVGVA